MEVFQPCTDEQTVCIKTVKMEAEPVLDETPTIGMGRMIR